MEGKIVDPQPQEDGGQPVGEIAIRGAIVMKGYWNRPDATAAVLRDGWLYTGDLGYFDAGGNLFITGRKKEVIILSNGKNIYPEEVEAHYLQVALRWGNCCHGDGRPSRERTGCMPWWFPNFEALKQRKIVNAKEVIRYDIESLSLQLPSTKRIGSYEIWQEALPRTTTRKLKRFEIEKRVRANQAEGRSGDAEVSAEKPLSAEDAAWLEQADVQRALKIMREASRLKPQSIRPSDNLELDLGLDSMQRVELLVALEQEIGGDLEESRLSEIYTVRELVDAVHESAAGSRRWPTPRSLRRMESCAAGRACGSGGPRAAPAAAVQGNVLVRCQPVGPDHCARPFSSARERSGETSAPRTLYHLLQSPELSRSDHSGQCSTWRVFRDSFAVGTSEIFGRGFLRTLARWLRVVVVDPDANLIPAMRAGAYGLRHGGVLLLYPEGERSIDGAPKMFKKGAAILSIHLQVPIVPVAIDGFHEAWPRGKPFQKFAPLQIDLWRTRFIPRSKQRRRRRRTRNLRPS